MAIKKTKYIKTYAQGASNLIPRDDSRTNSLKTELKEDLNKRNALSSTAQSSIGAAIGGPLGGAIGSATAEIGSSVTKGLTDEFGNYKSNEAEYLDMQLNPNARMNAIQSGNTSDVLAGVTGGVSTQLGETLLGEQGYDNLVGKDSATKAKERYGILRKGAQDAFEGQQLVGEVDMVADRRKAKTLLSYKDGGKEVRSPLNKKADTFPINIEGKRDGKGNIIPETVTDKNFNVIAKGTRPHSEGGNTVLATEGANVFNPKSVEEAARLNKALSERDLATLKKERDKLPDDRERDKNKPISNNSNDMSNMRERKTLVNSRQTPYDNTGLDEVSLAIGGLRSLRRVRQEQEAAAYEEEALQEYAEGGKGLSRRERRTLRKANRQNEKDAILAARELKTNQAIDEQYRIETEEMDMRQNDEVYNKPIAERDAIINKRFEDKAALAKWNDSAQKEAEYFERTTKEEADRVEEANKYKSPYSNYRNSLHPSEVAREQADIAKLSSARKPDFTGNVGESPNAKTGINKGELLSGQQAIKAEELVKSLPKKEEVAKETGDTEDTEEDKTSGKDLYAAGQFASIALNFVKGLQKPTSPEVFTAAKEQYRYEDTSSAARAAVEESTRISQSAMHSVSGGSAQNVRGNAANLANQRRTALAQINEGEAKKQEGVAAANVGIRNEVRATNLGFAVKREDDYLKNVAATNAYTQAAATELSKLSASRLENANAREQQEMTKEQMAAYYDTLSDAQKVLFRNKTGYDPTSGTTKKLKKKTK